MTCRPWRGRLGNVFRRPCYKANRPSEMKLRDYTPNFKLYDTNQALFFTASSIERLSVSKSRASGSCFKGATGRRRSASSRASMSDRIRSNATPSHGIPSCFARRWARTLALAVRKIFNAASGKITEPISRPSATKPFSVESRVGAAKGRCAL